MSVSEISAKVGEGEAIAVKKNLGDNLSDLVKMCSANDQNGEDVVRSNAVANITIRIQDIIRAGIKAGKDQKAIQADTDAYVPGLKRRGKTRQEKMAEDFSKLSPEERKDLLSRLTKGG